MRARTRARLERRHARFGVLLEPGERRPGETPVLAVPVQRHAVVSQPVGEASAPWGTFGHGTSSSPRNALCRAAASRTRHRRRRPGRLAIWPSCSIENGYDVAGIIRARCRPIRTSAGIGDRIELVEADLLDQDSLVRALRATRATEVYNLARRRSCRAPGTSPCSRAEFAAVGVTSLLEAIRAGGHRIRFYQASSSEIFGEPRETPQTETTPLSPVTPYGVAKAYGHFIIASYRRRYGLLRLLRDPLQPRVAAAAARLPAPQGRARGRGDLARARAASSCSAISTRGATGATPPTTCARCG